MNVNNIFLILLIVVPILVKGGRGRDWKGYVDKVVIAGKVLNHCAIAGLKGKVWAQSDGFNVRSTEVVNVVDQLANPESISAEGVTVGGVHYISAKGHQQSIHAWNGPIGVVIEKTIRTIIVGTYKEKTQSEDAAEVVRRMANVLLSHNY